MKAIDVVILAFLLSHIPITLMVDSQAVLPAEWYPQVLRDVHSWYLSTHKDPLMGGMPLWFKSLVWTEILLQLPFFFVAIYAWLARKNWIRIPAIIYGSFVCATMVPILTVLATHEAPGYKPMMLFGFYLPYLLLPLLIVIYCAVTPNLFSSTSGNGKSKRA